jgi:hypothetical protein
MKFLLCVAVMALVACDGETGPRGAEGSPGAPGQDGTAQPGAPGQDGEEGTDGTDGTDGVDGTDGDPGPGLTFTDPTAAEVPVRFIGNMLVWFDTNARHWQAPSGSPTHVVSNAYYSEAGCAGDVALVLRPANDTTSANDGRAFIGSTFIWEGVPRAVAVGAEPVAGFVYGSVRGGEGAPCDLGNGTLPIAAVDLEDVDNVTLPALPLYQGFLTPELQ